MLLINMLISVLSLMTAGGLIGLGVREKIGRMFFIGVFTALMGVYFLVSAIGTLNVHPGIGG